MLPPYVVAVSPLSHRGLWAHRPMWSRENPESRTVACNYPPTDLLSSDQNSASSFTLSKSILSTLQWRKPHRATVVKPKPLFRVALRIACWVFRWGKKKITTLLVSRFDLLCKCISLVFRLCIECLWKVCETWNNVIFKNVKSLPSVFIHVVSWPKGLCLKVLPLSLTQRHSYCTTHVLAHRNH